MDKSKKGYALIFAVVTCTVAMVLATTILSVTVFVAGMADRTEQRFAEKVALDNIGNTYLTYLQDSEKGETTFDDYIASSLKEGYVFSVEELSGNRTSLVVRKDNTAAACVLHVICNNATVETWVYNYYDYVYEDTLGYQLISFVKEKGTTFGNETDLTGEFKAYIQNKISLDEENKYHGLTYTVTVSNATTITLTIQKDGKETLVVSCNNQGKQAVWKYHSKTQGEG